MIELGGILYHASAGQVRTLVDQQEVEEDCWLITDFGESVSRMTTEEGAARYAEVMIRKSLQETGEFDEPVSLVTHWKRKRGANATDVLYTAMPTRRYYQYIEDAKAREAITMLFPLYSVLLGVLRKAAPTAPWAVVLQHGRFADLLIGTRKRIYYANRCVAFDESAEQVQSLWQTVFEDIKNTEFEHRIEVEKLLLISWVNTVFPEEIPRDVQWNMEELERDPVLFDGESSQVSLLRACRTLKTGAALSGGLERTAFVTRRLLPAMNATALLACLFLLGGAYWMENRAESLKAELKGARSALSKIEIPGNVTPVEYEGVYRFTRDLATLARTPSFAQILNDLYQSFPRGAKADLLEVSRENEKMEVRVYAELPAPFSAAYKGYQRLCNRLRGMGYEVGTEDFDTTISRSRFLLRLKRKTS